MKISQGFKVVNLPVKYFFIIAIFGFILSGNVSGHENISAYIGINEKTGKYLPPDLTFFDEEGKKVRAKDIIRKPTVLTLVYYTCDHMCPQILEGLAVTLDKMELLPGRDYAILTVSFDERDTPEIAGSVKKNYVRLIHKPLPENFWRFLTARGDSIKILTEAVGFRFQKDMHGFIHPAVLIILSPNGKITKYVHVSKYSYGVAYPITFVPLDLTMSLNDASQGKVTASPETSTLICFPHEPAKEEKFFGILGIAGTSTLFLLVVFFVYLITTSKKFQGWKR